ncbi:putative F-box domain-containing protein [Tanacetum coccineum]|uniref:F-box domain-containing protein n=1 Tax=Tanacetum coccineum TaxID=301880 RepID=A0ABQ5BFY1_9ASTR
MRGRRTTVYFCQAACPHGRQDPPNPGLTAWAGYANNRTKTRAIIWNPTVNKSVAIDVVSKVSYTPETLRTIVGFGVNRETLDPMLVKITNNFWINPKQVEIYTLSSGAWRRARGNMPRESTNITLPSINIDKFIYWLAYRHRSSLIVAFDMMSEDFSEVGLPYNLTSRFGDLDICKLRGSLVVLQRQDKSNFRAWMMKNGDPKTFTHIFTINTPNATIARVLGFRKSGEHVLEIRKDGNNAELFTYNILFLPGISGKMGFKPRPISQMPFLIQPHKDVYDEGIDVQGFTPKSSSQPISPIGITGDVNSFFASSYIETLLLLDH